MAKPWAAPFALVLAVSSLPLPAQAQDEAPPTAPAISEAPPPPVPDGYDLDALAPPAPEAAANTPAPAPEPPAAAPAPAPTSAASAPKPSESDSALEQLSDAPPVEDTAPPVATTDETPPAPAEPAAEPAPEIAQAAEPVPQSQVRRRNRRVPTYQQVQPQLGIEAAFSNNAMGKSLITPDQEDPARGLSIAVDYQPKALQRLGVIGLGASAGIYPISGVTSTPFSIYSVGGQLRYQARFFHEQPIVPTVAYHFDFYNYWLGSTGASGHVLAQGPSLGAWILLSFFDVEEASRFYAEYGIARSYLVIEARKTTGDNGLVAFSGTSYFFGLRFEL